MNGGAEFPGVSSACPDEVGVPLKVTVVVALLACHLSANVNGDVQQRMGAGSGADVQGDWSCGTAGSRNVFLRGNNVGALRTNGVAVTHPAEPEGTAERGSQLAVQTCNQHVLANRQLSHGARFPIDDIQLSCANLRLPEIAVGGTRAPFFGKILVES